MKAVDVEWVVVEYDEFIPLLLYPGGVVSHTETNLQIDTSFNFSKPSG
jgi:hypothetical protein